jgi:putative drug exporter of the RND superfamily
MPAAFARLIVRRAKAVLFISVLLAVGAAMIGGGVAEKLSSGGFDDPSSPSSQAKALVEKQFGGGVPNLVIVATAQAGTPQTSTPQTSTPQASTPQASTTDSAAATQAGLALTKQLSQEEGVANVVSYWSLQAPPLRSNNGTQALILARIVGDEDMVREHIEKLSPKYSVTTGAITTQVTGEAEVFRQVGETVEKDLKRAELIALPVTLLLLVLVFSGLVASSLPLLVGAMTVMGTFLVLDVVNRFTQVSIFSLNLTTALGLGLAIDYALFIVSRFREERATGWPIEDAVVRTIRTAGRTVVFSALTVAVSLSALLVFPLAFLRSFAYAGIAVSIIAALAATVALPALITILGDKVNAGKIPLPFTGRGKNTPKAARADQEGMWHRIAMAVMRRPVAVAISGTALLLVLGTPFLGIKFGLSDYRVLPKELSSRQAQEAITTGFTSREAGAVEVVLPDVAATQDLRSYAIALSSTEGVARVDSRDGSFAGGAQVGPPNETSLRFGQPTDTTTWLAVIPSVEPISPAGEELVSALKKIDSPAPVLLGGPSAELVDAKSALFSRLPYALAIISIVTFVVLFLLFGGILVPIKALLLNLLSLSATFGAMVWIFQDGNFSDALGFTPTGTIDITTPILMFCIAFGLSMDYEVFLLSRIKEEHDRGLDNTSAVALGLEKTGRIVTAAALLISVVFVAFAASGVTFIKLFGLGLALAVLVDAFVIRATLVPAFMRLAGEANWWAPAPLRRLQQRIGLSEHVELDEFPGLVADDAAKGTNSMAKSKASTAGASGATVAGDTREFISS